KLAQLPPPYNQIFQDLDRLGSMLTQDFSEKSAEHICIHCSQILQYLLIGKLLSKIKSNTLIKQGQGVTHRTVRSLSDVADSFILHIIFFFFHTLSEPVCNGIHRDPLKIIPLAS